MTIIAHASHCNWHLQSKATTFNMNCNRGSVRAHGLLRARCVRHACSSPTWYLLMRHIDEAESFGAVRLPHLATAPRFALGSRWQGQQHRRDTEGDLQPPHRTHRWSTGRISCAGSVTDQEIQIEGGFFFLQWAGFRNKTRRAKLLTLGSGTSTSLQ